MKKKFAWQCLIFSRYSSSPTPKNVVSIPIFYTQNVFKLQMAITSQSKARKFFGSKCFLLFKF